MKKKRILIVDDETAASWFLKCNLEETGSYEVYVENRAIRAQAAAEVLHPDLIFLDIMMPELDGGELAERFQASPKLRLVPIVFLTAAATRKEVNANGGKIGGLPFLAKPVDMPEVIACLEQQLGR